MLNGVKPPNNRHLSGCAKADDRWSQLLNVALRKTEVKNPLLTWAIKILGRLLFYSKSNVNFKFLCLVFIYLANDDK